MVAQGSLCACSGSMAESAQTPSKHSPHHWDRCRASPGWGLQSPNQQRDVESSSPSVPQFPPSVKSGTRSAKANRYTCHFCTQGKCSQVVTDSPLGARYDPESFLTQGSRISDCEGPCLLCFTLGSPGPEHPYGRAACSLEKPVAFG